MAKNLKLNIKNSQIAKALKIGGAKPAAAPKKKATKKDSDKELKKGAHEEGAEAATAETEAKPARVVRARSRSAFVPGTEKSEEHASDQPSAEEREESEEAAPAPIEEETPAPEVEEVAPAPVVAEAPAVIEEPVAPVQEAVKQVPEPTETAKISAPPQETPTVAAAPTPKAAPVSRPAPIRTTPTTPRPQEQQRRGHDGKREESRPPVMRSYTPLGPTGRHVRDLAPKPKPKPPTDRPAPRTDRPPPRPGESRPADTGPRRPHAPAAGAGPVPPKEGAERRGDKRTKAREYRDLRPAAKAKGGSDSFDARDRHGLRAGEEERHRKRRPKKGGHVMEDLTIRPDVLSIRLPITVKDLAVHMKLKASQLISKLFMQGVVLTINDILEDDTTVVLLGEEFGCKISIDTSEEERIRVTDRTIQEEIDAADSHHLKTRPPVVTFMGHVDHGKTSLLDAIRKSNVASGEAGAITQHMGAFLVHTPQGAVAFLDTPGHEAFSAMRARGAEVTDIVVLVVAGDEGMRQQTLEAVQHALAAGVTIMVAINKCDKPNFNAENVYRQLADNNLLPEAWGGSTVTVNTSAVTGEGIDTLLEMLALQAEVLELRADPTARARGVVLESEMHKGFGQVATFLVQNGTLRLGDAVVIGPHWARIKTMRDEHGRTLKEAGPSTPVEITGLSGLPEAGEEFVAVANDVEARSIAETRMEETRTKSLARRKMVSLESMLQDSGEKGKKILNLVLRADVQGSLEALKESLGKIESEKASVNIIFSGVGDISESDIQLAAASNAAVIGFHTRVEAHADSLIKQLGVAVKTFDIIYHAVDGIRLILTGMLDKVAREEPRGNAEVRATFQASQIGTIAGCQVIDGTIARNQRARLMREGKAVWEGALASIKRHKDDVKEVSKGMECGIVLENCNDIKEGDIISTYDVIYESQEL